MKTPYQSTIRQAHGKPNNELNKKGNQRTGFLKFYPNPNLKEDNYFFSFKSFCSFLFFKNGFLK